MPMSVTYSIDAKDAPSSVRKRLFPQGSSGHRVSVEYRVIEMDAEPQERRSLLDAFLDTGAQGLWAGDRGDEAETFVRELRETDNKRLDALLSEDA